MADKQYKSLVQTSKMPHKESVSKMPFEDAKEYLEFDLGAGEFVEKMWERLLAGERVIDTQHASFPVVYELSEDEPDDPYDVLAKIESELDECARKEGKKPLKVSSFRLSDEALQKLSVCESMLQSKKRRDILEEGIEIIFNNCMTGSKSKYLEKITYNTDLRKTISENEISLGQIRLMLEGLLTQKETINVIDELLITGYYMINIGYLTIEYRRI